jgi:hypothetical protein
VALLAKVRETLAVIEYEFVGLTKGCGPWMETGVNRTATRNGGQTELLEGLPARVVDPGPDG